MRATIDLDENDIIIAREAWLDGVLLTGKIPEMRLGNSKGFHLIFHNLSSAEFSWFVRWWLGDDENRMFLDLNGPKSTTQVLFSEKCVIYPDFTKFGRSMRWGISGDSETKTEVDMMKKCRYCGCLVDMIRHHEERCIENPKVRNGDMREDTIVDSPHLLPQRGYEHTPGRGMYPWRVYNNVARTGVHVRKEDEMDG